MELSEQSARSDIALSGRCVSHHRWMKDGEFAKLAACVGQAPYFDLCTKEEVPNTTVRSRINQWRMRNARKVCDNCPVFLECGERAMNRRAWGVIVCGVPLRTHPSEPRSYRKLREILEARRLSDERDSAEVVPVPNAESGVHAGAEFASVGVRVLRSPHLELLPGYTGSSILHLDPAIVEDPAAC